MTLLVLGATSGTGHGLAGRGDADCGTALAARRIRCRVVRRNRRPRLASTL